MIWDKAGIERGRKGTLQRRNVLVQQVADLIVWLAEGRWVTYEAIAKRFGVAYKTARRRVRALEEAGLPIEYRVEVRSAGRYPLHEGVQGVRLTKDWVSRRRWLLR